MRSRLLIPVALAVVIAAVALFAQADVPQNMNVQGRLTDSAGDPVGPQVLIYTFKIYDMEVGGTEIWPGGAGETHAVATDDNGVWNANVGEFLGLPPAVFADTVRWLEITIDDGINPAEVLSRVKLNTSPYGGQSETSRLADNGVPVGSVIDWWRPNAGFPVPADYAICDGSVLADPDSPFDGETLPDLRDQFVRGANTAGDIGVTGGSDSHLHSVTGTAASHLHAVNPAAVTSSSSGSHNHIHDHPSTSTTTTGSHNNNLAGALDASHAHVSTHSHSVNLGSISSSSAANHTHSVNIASTSSSSVSSSVTGTTTNDGNVPSYVALLKIMKIK